LLSSITFANIQFILILYQNDFQISVYSLQGRTQVRAASLQPPPAQIEIEENTDSVDTMVWVGMAQSE